MDDDVEAIAGFRKHKIAREQVIVCFAYLERVLDTGISFLKPLLQSAFRNVK